MTDVTDSSITLIELILERSSHIAVKKLSNNDRRWADGHGHQNGPYIPAEWREGGFFPRLKNTNTEKAHIFEVFVSTCWVRTGEFRESRLANYSNKRTECHLTRVVKSEFAGISPASWLVIGKGVVRGDSVWFCLVVDSADDEGYSFVETLFELASDFEYGLFETAHLPRAVGTSLDFIEELKTALERGEMNAFMATTAFPTTQVLAAKAQEVWLAETGEPDLNPFRLAAPGNALMKVSRDIEYRLFRHHTMRHYAAKLLAMLSDGRANPGIGTFIVSLVTQFDTIYKEVMVSAGQRAKSRAGYSFEQHVSRMLKDGNVPFEEQKFVGNQRPDFILPSLQVFKKAGRHRDEAFILSLKTLLRERWKQVLAENKSSDLFLGTVDDGIAGEAIAEMKVHNIYLVVPERFKDSECAEYANHNNVITFREFFRSELIRRTSVWNASGLHVTLNMPLPL